MFRATCLATPSRDKSHDTLHSVMFRYKRGKLFLSLLPFLTHQGKQHNILCIHHDENKYGTPVIKSNKRKGTLTSYNGVYEGKRYLRIHLHFLSTHCSHLLSGNQNLYRTKRQFSLKNYSCSSLCLCFPSVVSFTGFYNEDNVKYELTLKRQTDYLSRIHIRQAGNLSDVLTRLG